MKTIYDIRERTGPLMIAVADDVEEIQMLAREWLTSVGHVVSCAPDGRALCQLAKQQRFDVVITDIVMPEADGFEVIGTLRRQNPGLKIIAMSGGGNVMAATDCLRIAERLGADVVLRKPFNRAQLMQAVDRVCPGAATQAAS